MRKALFLLSVLALMGWLSAADQPVNFSGNCVLDVRNSDMQGGQYEPVPYAIRHKEDHFQIRTIPVGARTFIETFRLDGAETVEPMSAAVPPQFRNDRRITKATLQRGRVKVIQETRGPDGQVRALVEREWSLSEDGNTLTLRSKLSNGPSPTLVFHKSKQEPDNGPISKPDTVTARQPASIPKPPSAADLRLPRSPGMDAVFEVTVTDANKEPLARVFVNYRNLDNSLNGGGVTDAAGKFRSSYYPGPYRIEAIREGFRQWVSKPVILKSGETQKIEIVLVPKGAPVAAVESHSKGYIQLAIETVRTDLVARGEKDAGKLRLVPAGEPILKPDCSKLHQKGLKAAEMPDAVVLINIYKENSLKEQAKVVFVDRQPVATFSGQASVFSQDAMNEEELRKAAGEMDSFFTTAIDIRIGSERFYKYLPENIRSMFMYPDRKLRMYIPPGAVDESWREQLAKELASRGARQRPLDGIDGWREKLSDDELRQFAALTLDLTAQGLWFAFEGLEGIEGGNLKPDLLVSDPPGFIRMLKEAVSKNRSQLESLGLFSPEHLNLTSSYIKQLLGEGLIVKEVSRPEPCPCFREGLKDEALYLVSMGPWGIHFSRANGNPRIACIALP